MMTELKSHDDFFRNLEALFAARKGKDHGAIYLTQKRLTHGHDTGLPASTDPFADVRMPESPFPILIRATDGKSREERSKRIKLSTVVQSNDLDGFFTRYADVCKVGMTTLRPRDRSKRKGKAKKRKPAATVGTT